MADFIRIPPDGSGKKMLSKYNANLDVYAQGVVLSDSLDPTRMHTITEDGSAQTTFVNGSPEFDAFGRMLVTNEISVYATEFTDHIVSQSLYRWDTGLGDGNIVDSALVLSTGTSADDSIIYQTNKYFKYTPGFSTTYMFTIASGDSGKAGVVRRVGAFDALDGIFYQIDENGLSVVIRDSLSNTENIINQADFNGDPLDGTGLSELTLDLTKDNIYWIKYQWLGAGAVTFGMSINGKKITLHTIGHFNALSLPYMHDGHRPFRVEQVNTGITASSSEFRFFCVSVLNDANAPKHLNSGFASVEVSETYNNTTGEVHVISLRPSETHVNGKDNRLKITVPIEFISGMSTTPGLFRINVYLNATITGGTWENATLNSQVNKTATVTGGFLLTQRLIKTDGDVFHVQDKDPYIITRKAEITETETFSVTFEKLRGDDILFDASFTIAEGR